MAEDGGDPISPPDSPCPAAAYPPVRGVPAGHSSGGSTDSSASSRVGEYTIKDIVMTPREDDDDLSSTGSMASLADMVAGGGGRGAVEERGSYRADEYWEGEDQVHLTSGEARQEQESYSREQAAQEGDLPPAYGASLVAEEAWGRWGRGAGPGVHQADQVRLVDH